MRGTRWLLQTVRACAACRHEKTLYPSEKLTQMNLSLRSLWSSTMVVIKPWNGGIARAEDWMFPTPSIPHIADRISEGIRRLSKLLRTQARLLCMHKSGKVVSNRPPAPPSPNKQLMLLTEVDTYLCTVAEAATALVATDLWQPGPVQAAPLKRLQPGAKKGKTPRGGAQGKGHYKGSRGHGNIAADAVVAPADEEAPAVTDVGPLSSISGFITITGNGRPPFSKYIFFLL